jgi:hypothetical protein
MPPVSRRGFIQLLATAAASAAALGIDDDPEKLLWEPGKKTIFIPELVTPKNIAPEVPKMLVTDQAQVDDLYKKLTTDGAVFGGGRRAGKTNGYVHGGWEIVGNNHAPLAFDMNWQYMGDPKDLADANQKLAKFFPEAGWSPNHDIVGAALKAESDAELPILGGGRTESPAAMKREDIDTLIASIRAALNKA